MPAALKRSVIKLRRTMNSMQISGVIGDQIDSRNGDFLPVTQPRSWEVELVSD